MGIIIMGNCEDFCGPRAKGIKNTLAITPIEKSNTHDVYDSRWNDKESTVAGTPKSTATGTPKSIAQGTPKYNWQMDSIESEDELSMISSDGDDPIIEYKSKRYRRI